MKHAILGVGAIGGLVGAALSSFDEKVTVVVRPESLASYPANLTLERPTGPLTAPARGVASLTETVDVLWIATKTYQLDATLASVRVMPSCIVPLLNGVDHVALLRARFGPERVVPATIAVEAEKIAPGRFIQRSPFVRLNLAASGEARLGAIIVRLRELGFTCQFVRSEQTLLWSKLCFLAPLALVTSAADKSIGEVFADSVWKSRLTSAIHEACAVAKASDAEVEAPRILAFAAGLPPEMRSSMQKDLAAGRRLELDAIGGPIVRGGQDYGIDVSATTSLIAAIQSKIER